MTALRDEVLALRRKRAELARGKAALQGEVCLDTVSLCPSPWEQRCGAQVLHHPAQGARPGVSQPHALWGQCPVGQAWV